jgi:hypothetical protein
MDVGLEQRRANHTKAGWHSTRDNDAERARNLDTWCHVIADYGYMQPTLLREGRIRIGISERTKQEVLSAAPMGETHASNGWT